MAEQRRTNRLLETALFGGIGFALGLLVMLALVRQNLF
jgi:ubiquinone biosynthesis protein